MHHTEQVGMVVTFSTCTCLKL